ncbi:MAG: hypothetical protein ABMB14_02840 [Myxococcota bacterium]
MLQSLALGIAVPAAVAVVGAAIVRSGGIRARWAPGAVVAVATLAGALAIGIRPRVPVELVDFVGPLVVIGAVFAAIRPLVGLAAGRWLGAAWLAVTGVGWTWILWPLVQYRWTPGIAVGWVAAAAIGTTALAVATPQLAQDRRWAAAYLAAVAAGAAVALAGAAAIRDGTSAVATGIVPLAVLIGGGLAFSATPPAGAAWLLAATLGVSVARGAGRTAFAAGIALGGAAATVLAANRG